MGYFSTLNRTVAYPFDKLTELRAYSAAAISATTAGTAIAFDIPDQYEFKAVLNHAAISSVVATSAEWVVTLEVSPDNSTFTAIRSWTLTGTASQFETPVSGIEINAKVANATHIRAKATKTGTPGTLTYGLILTIC